MKPTSAAPTPVADPPLRACDQAALALHQPQLCPAEITGRLERLVLELGLAGEAVFLPPGAHPDQRPSAEEPVVVAVAGPDQVLRGHLRCRVADDEALGYIRVLAAHAAVALGTGERMREVERREESVRRVAERLQDALLPPLPAVPHTSLQVQYRAASREARVGGDFYDVFVLPDGRTLIVVGDVMGKGVEAASLTSRITQTLRALALQDPLLETLLERADRQVAFQDPETMATLWCGIYEPLSGELEFASMGHPPALLVRHDRDPVRLELEGLPLGLRDLTGTAPECRRRRLEPRDLLVLYTDGVVEASRDYLAGQQALLEAIHRRRDEPLTELVPQVLDELLADAGHTDDALLLLLRRR